MINTLPTSGQTRDDRTSYHSTYGAFSPESAVDGPADKCGSTSGACRGSMAPAQFAQPSHTEQACVVSNSVLPQQQFTSLHLPATGHVDRLPSLQLPQQPSKAQQHLLEQAGYTAVSQQAAGNELQQQAEQQLTESEDDSWTPGQPACGGDAVADNEVDEEETWDPTGPPPQYCTNCTARLYTSECSDCGHSSEHDEALFDCSRDVQAVAAESAARRPLIIWDDDMLLHDEGKAVPHPERPDRLRAIMARLTSNGLTGGCIRVDARLATRQELLRCHTEEHLQRLQLFCSGTVPATIIPSDTYINQHTLHCAALAAGSAAEAAVRVFRGEAACGAAIIRPPGHHAESNTAMGFCFFNNAAVAARAAQAAGAERVLILDWDVHHGNGTQHIFERDPDVLYMSLHRYDRGSFYPGTGAAEEVGTGRGAGFTVNVPWDAGNIGSGDYMAAMQQVIVPIAREFAPDLIIISAGFDAAEGDPIGGCCVTPACFGNMTAELLPIAPTVLLLEGGYNLLATAQSTEACLQVLLGQQPEQLQARPSAFGWLAIQAAKKAHSRYWSCLAGAFPQLHAGVSLQQQLRLMGSRGQGQFTWESQHLRQGFEYADDYEEPEYEDDEGEAETDDVDEQGYVGGQQDDAVMYHHQQQLQQHQKLCEQETAAAYDAGFGSSSYDLQQRHSWDGHSSKATSFRQSSIGGQSNSRGPAEPSAAADADAMEQDVAATGKSLQQRRHRQLSRKQQMLRAIHKQAMKSFWRRRLKHSMQQQQQ